MMMGVKKEVVMNLNEKEKVKVFASVLFYLYTNNLQVLVLIVLAGLLSSKRRGSWFSIRQDPG